MAHEKSSRIWELDFFRGIALILMVYFHFIYDMKDIYRYNVNYDTGINYYLGKMSAILFILIAGISSTLSSNNLKRGLKVFTAGMGITLATYLYNRGFIIKFGILHFLGISMMLYPFFCRINRYVLLVIGTAVIIAGNVISKISAANDYFLVFGLTSDSFFSADYYPLMPWFGVFLYGTVIGKLLYSQRRSIFSFTIRDNIISNMGRHTLIYYIIHQPIIISLLALMGKFR